MYKKFWRILLLILTIAAALLIAGCKHNHEDDETPNPTEISTAIGSMGSNLPVATPHITKTEEPSLEPTGSFEPNTDNAEYSGYIYIEDNGVPARDTMPTDLNGLSEGECEAWFSDCVFIGDSIMLGWKNYNSLMLQKDGTFFGNTRFFCEGSYGFGHALEPVTDDSLHPMYGGQKCSVGEAINLMSAEKAFICFGLNDLSIYGVDGTLTNCEELIMRIYDEAPWVDLYFISAMYMYKGSERNILNNSNIMKLNQGIAKICDKYDITFVNIASNLIDENGYVPDKFSSDQYVHQTYAAYDVWAAVLRSTASRAIVGIPDPKFK